MKTTAPNFRTGAACVLAAMLAATGCASIPVDLDDDLVVPGERVGPVVIGMPLSDLLDVMGTPRNTELLEGSNASYSFDGITVGAREKVYWIIADSPRFHTAEGVSPGDEQIVARAAFSKKPACVVSRGDATVYDYKNIYFKVDNGTGKVTQLGVQKKTTTCK